MRQDVQMTGAGPLVLVADDNGFSRRMIAQMLRQDGFRVLEASDGAEALQHAVTTPHIDLMTLDLEMPAMDGFQVLQAMRDPARMVQLERMGNARLPVILVTANDTYANRLRGFELGAADFVHKDQVQEQLALTARLITTPSTVFKDITVLVTDDAPLARRVVVACVRQLGVHVVEACDGAEALDILRQDGPKADMLITDMHMPRMNGDEVCRRVRQELGLREMPILLISATSDHETKLKLFQAGATDYLEKPFIKEELVARLSVHLKRLQLDRHLRANLVRLRELDKLKDQFLSVCSHDLRTPLTGVLGYADLLMREPDLREEHRDMLRQIQDSGRYLLELIEDLLDLGRAQAQKQTLAFEPLNMVDVLESCVGAFRALAREKHLALELNVAADADGAWVQGHSTSLARVCTNLLSNAIKFTPDGGRVTLRIWRDEARAKWMVACADSGVGIPAAMLPDLFNRYTKVSRSGTRGERGTGLGLTIARELVEAHDGQLHVHSVEGQGSTFTIELPVFSGITEEEPGVWAAESSAREGERPRRVLVADDNPANLKLVALLLKKLGHTVVAVENGREGLAAVQSADVGFDVALMDVEMPEMDGRQALAAIRAWERDQNRPPLAVVALTAHTEAAEHQRLRESGFNAVMSKPIQPEVLDRILRDAAVWRRSGLAGAPQQ